MNLKPTFVSLNLESNQDVYFRVYNIQGNLILNQQALEWAEGVYYLDLDLQFNNTNPCYLIIAEEINGNWKSAKIFTKNDTI